MQYFGFVGTPNMGDMNLGSMEDMAKMGVAMGVISNIIGNDAIAPLTQSVQNATASLGWICVCGCSCTEGSFCTNCGTKRPSPFGKWNCVCGCTGLDSQFCTNCGRKKA